MKSTYVILSGGDPGIYYGPEEFRSHCDKSTHTKYLMFDDYEDALRFAHGADSDYLNDLLKLDNPKERKSFGYVYGTINELNNICGYAGVIQLAGENSYPEFVSGKDHRRTVLNLGQAGAEMIGTNELLEHVGSIHPEEFYLIYRIPDIAYWYDTRSWVPNRRHIRRFRSEVSHIEMHGTKLHLVRIIDYTMMPFHEELYKRAETNCRFSNADERPRGKYMVPGKPFAGISIG
jgi:hypothetical protein